MECPSCKADIPEDSKCCIECGTSLQLACAACAHTNPSRAKFCANCGSKLTRDAFTASVEAASRSPSPATVPLTSGAERRQLTVMFCDLVGSTSLAARLDPEEMGELLRSYQNTVAREISRFEGRIAKFMGDGVLAYFGWPTAHENEAERAVRAGLALIAAVGRLASPTGVQLGCRVGIATGVVMVGELIGEGAAQEEVVVGETPNLAARLQAAAEPNCVVIAETTRRLIGALFTHKRLQLGPLKGLGDTTIAWRVLGEGGAESRFEALHAGELPPLVGREHELALLFERWQLAKGGEGQCVLIAGEPGIGKSRLVLSLHERLSQERRTGLRYQCSPHHANSAFWPVIDQLERAAGFGSDDGPSEKLSKLEHLLGQGVPDAASVTPLVAALLSISTADCYPPLSLSPQAQKAQTMSALLAQLEGLATKCPVLIVLEDAHWLDPTTKELFDLIVDRIRRIPVLLVVTFRLELAVPWVGLPHITLLTLNRLTRTQAARLIAWAAGGRALPDEIVEAILSRTEGVPLFIEELTKTVVESGLLRQTAHGFALAGPLPPLAIPSTLRDSLMARLDRLAPTKEVAQTAACIGREFGYRLLAAVARLGETQLQKALDQLVGAELVFRRGTPPEAVYSFKHSLVRDTAYESLLRSRRQQLHGKIANALEQEVPDVADVEPETVAHHLTEAGSAERAVEYWLKAGHRASSRSAHNEAISHFAQGLQLLATLPATGEKARWELELQIGLGAPLIATKGFAAPEVEMAYARAQQLGRDLGERAHLATALRGLCYVHHVRARLHRVEEIGTELLELAGQTSDSVLQADARNAMGFNLFHLGRFQMARDHLQRAAEQLDRSGGLVHATSLGVNVGVFNLAYAGHCDWHLGYPDRALQEVHQAIDLAHQLAHPFSLAVALAYTAMLHQFRREPKQVEEWAKAVLAVSRKHGFTYYQAWAEILAGWAYASSGAATDGILRVRRGLAGIRATGAGLRLPYYLGLLGELHLEAGQAEAATSALSEAFVIAERNGESWNDGNLWLLKGDIRRVSDVGETAEACYAKAIEISHAQGARSLALRGTLGLARHQAAHGCRAEAHDLLVPLANWFSTEVKTPEINEARALVESLA